MTAFSEAAHSGERVGVRRNKRDIGGAAARRVQRDTIADFDPAEYVLDLRAWGEPFELVERKDGLRLKAGGEVLDLLSADGSLTAASLDGDMILL